MFTTQISVRPSLTILNALHEFDDFMESIRTLVDLGCGTGEDLEWWASATTRDEQRTPLNIKCTGVDLSQTLSLSKKYPNISYQRTDFEQTINAPQNLFDILWCHDAFQYCMDPINTLGKWRQISSDGAMLVIAVPQTLQIKKQKLQHHLPNGVFYHHTLVSLMYMLAVNGWDCRSGFFQQRADDPWIRAVVYKSQQTFQDPKKTTWYDLMEAKLLPESADRSIHANGYLIQRDLILPWLDKSLASMAQL